MREAYAKTVFVNRFCYFSQHQLQIRTITHVLQLKVGMLESDLVSERAKKKQTF